MEQQIDPGHRSGIIHIPPSKSDAQRAILCAALANGKSILKNVGKSADELSMLTAVEQIGAKLFKIDDRTIEIMGIEEFPQNLDLNLNESGLGIRLLTCICAAHSGEYKLNGEGTLLKRPMHFFEELFPKLNVEFATNNGYLPFSLKGPMQAGELSVDGTQSSQYISGLLMALPLLNGTSYMAVNNLISIPYVQMTLNTLSSFGIQIEHQQLKNFVIAGKQKYLPNNYTIEGDWSSASYWLVASALGSEITVSGLRMSSLQADKKILDAFIAAACSINNSNNGISIDGSKRKAFSFDATNCPDLFPALVTFAALTEGVSTIYGVKRLSTKESDRGEALRSEFEKLEILIEIHEDQMRIHGKSLLSGGRVKSHQDHRIAMCLGIAGIFARESIIIQDAESVSKSYPDYWNDFQNLEKVD